MAIKGPKGAHPTNRGWVHPRTGELLKSQRITQVQIDEWHGIPSSLDAVEEAIQDAFTEGKIQAAERDMLTSQTKAEIEAYGRTMGIELDRRKSKAKMIEQLQSHIDGN